MGEVWYAQKRTEKEQRIEGLFGEEAVAMELYRVLLVDDEEAIRTGISQKMDWQKLGFSLAGEASNGRDALELAEVLLPDVVLTDIKMPFLDGLGLCGSGVFAGRSGWQQGAAAEQCACQHQTGSGAAQAGSCRFHRRYLIS